MLPWEKMEKNAVVKKKEIPIGPKMEKNPMFKRPKCPLQKMKMLEKKVFKGPHEKIFKEE